MSITKGAFEAVMSELSKQYLAEVRKQTAHQLWNLSAVVPYPDSSDYLSVHSNTINEYTSNEGIPLGYETITIYLPYEQGRTGEFDGIEQAIRSLL